MARKASGQTAAPFAKQLTLNRWFLELFGVETFEDLAEPINSDKLTGLDDTNVHRFMRVLLQHFHDLPSLPDSLLLEYDANIVRHTQFINASRIRSGGDPVEWKYFQYLSLLACEIYLDRYFQRSKDERLQTNKLAFWMATGSGKTLIMHVHILQFRHYLTKHGEPLAYNRTLLLTPNEDLSRQHLGEFRKSGIDADLFTKEGRTLFSGSAVEIIEITKLREEMGEKSVAIDAFENNNLVLVDEGHRGTSTGEKGAWMRARNSLCEKGFSFEYSATFEQAVKTSPDLFDQYAKSILFDYSYRYFHGDGYGKDYLILNLDSDAQAQQSREYLIACLMTFVQQLKIFRDEAPSVAPFNVDKPLLLFVGSSVTATLADREATDIIDVLRFLNDFASKRDESIALIEHVWERGVVTSRGKDLFAGRFGFLHKASGSAAAVYDEALRLLFNAGAPGPIRITNLRGVDGELALSIGAQGERFGIINVNDDRKLLKLCTAAGLETDDSEFGQSLFDSINDQNSTINLLIGSRKFTEGWNSWRVSTMGLLNVGQKEGSQIIQLFGRGVRLKGYNMSLKRSSRIELPSSILPPQHMQDLETLAVFGLRANYMDVFRALLREEGLSDQQDPQIVDLPVLYDLDFSHLKVIRVSDNLAGTGEDAFSRLGPMPVLGQPNEYLRKNRVSLNWYPRIQSLTPETAIGATTAPELHQDRLTPRHIALLDADALHAEMERYKIQRGWHTLSIPRTAVDELLRDTSWYNLFIPPEQLTLEGGGSAALWQNIAESLLKRYTEHYYVYCKRQWELAHLEYRPLTRDDPNLISFMRVEVDASREEILADVERLRDSLQLGHVRELKTGGVQAIWFDRHLYQPLLFVDKKAVQVVPAALNKGEKRFVEDLKRTCEHNPVEGLYLLRNRSRGSGIGFFEAGNFHPDFILWLLSGHRQHIAFIDPKGLWNIESMSDPKVQFHASIKEIQDRLHRSAPEVTLDSFLISVTSRETAIKRFRTTPQELRDCGVLFQEDEHYVTELIAAVTASDA